MYNFRYVGIAEDVADEGICKFAFTIAGGGTHPHKEKAAACEWCEEATIRWLVTVTLATSVTINCDVWTIWGGTWRGSWRWAYQEWHSAACEWCEEATMSRLVTVTLTSSTSVTLTFDKKIIWGDAWKGARTVSQPMLLPALNCR